jgi:hypothetical protein
MFTQTNPSDNPQKGDKDRNPDGSRIAPPVSGPGDRPYGVMGVDKPHGGGNMESEAIADERVPAGAESPGLRPGPNPNNPQDVNNPFSTSRQESPSPISSNYATGTGGPSEVTTEELPTKNEDRAAAQRMGKKKKAVKAKSGRASKAKSASKGKSAKKRKAK